MRTLHASSRCLIRPCIYRPMRLFRADVELSIVCAFARMKDLLKVISTCTDALGRWFVPPSLQHPTINGLVHMSFPNLSELQLPKDTVPAKVPADVLAQAAEALRSSGCTLLDVSEDGTKIKRKEVR